MFMYIFSCVYFDEPKAKGSDGLTFIRRFSKEISSIIIYFFLKDWYRNLMLSKDKSMH